MEKQILSKANQLSYSPSDASSKVKSFISCKDLEGLKLYLNHFSKEKQSTIINHVQDEQAPFFHACLLGEVDIVNYMLTECNVDTELRGLYVLETENFEDRVTPLWVAVGEQFFPIVKLLVEHGADIHTDSSTYSTPVRCACYLNNLKIVRYLVENGANIHQPNVYGSTCLINATNGPVELCEFLVSNGASVNSTTIDGYTAMFHAIESDRFNLVRLFLGAGVSHFIKITTEVHILHQAAIQGNQTIFDYIRDNTVMKLSRLVEGYELLGASMIDDFDDIPKGLQFWEKAMDLRYTNPKAPLTKAIPEETKQVYRFHRETANPEECRSLITSDKDKIYMHALLARERILGTRHEQTIIRIWNRGVTYANSNHYQRTVDLWKYAYGEMRRWLGASDENVVSDLRKLKDLFEEMIKLSSSGQINEKVQASDIVDVFGMVVKQIQDFSGILAVRPLQKNTFENFRSLLVIAIDFIQLFYYSEGQDAEKEGFTEEVRRVIVLNPESEQGKQLLRLALMVLSDKMDAIVPSLDL